MKLRRPQLLRDLRGALELWAGSSLLLYGIRAPHNRTFSCMEANGGWRGWGSGRMIKTNHSWKKYSWMNIFFLYISFVKYFKLTCWLTTTILLKMNLIQHQGSFHQPGRYLHKKKVWPDPISCEDTVTYYIRSIRRRRDQWTNVFYVEWNVGI